MNNKIDFPIAASYKLNSDNKLELNIESKDGYKNLPEEIKKDIKHSFIWGRQRGAWVSRSKGGFVPYSMQKYNIPFDGAEELKSFEEMEERRADRLEHKAERFEIYAGNAKKRGEALCADFNKFRKDWAWLTQPIINSSGGRAFANHKNKVMDRYDRGMAELIKSNSLLEYAGDLAERSTKNQLIDMIYLENRIKENTKILKSFDEFNLKYSTLIENIDQQTDEHKIWLIGRINIFKLAGQKFAYYSHHKNLLVEKQKEIGNFIDVEALKKTVKKDFKAFLKEFYDINLLVMQIAYKSKSGVAYYFKTDKDLPKILHSGWAALNVAQMELTRIYKIMESVKAKQTLSLF